MSAMRRFHCRLTFAYYSITLWDLQSLQSVPNTLQVLKAKNKLFKKMSECRTTVFYDFKFRFPVIFSSNYRHLLVLEIPFPDHFISKYRTENLHFLSTGKYCAPLSTAGGKFDLEECKPHIDSLESKYV